MSGSASSDQGIRSKVLDLTFFCEEFMMILLNKSKAAVHDAYKLKE